MTTREKTSHNEGKEARGRGARRRTDAKSAGAREGRGACRDREEKDSRAEGHGRGREGGSKWSVSLPPFLVLRLWFVLL